MNPVVTIFRISVACAACLVAATKAHAATADNSRGGRFSWARLVTPDSREAFGSRVHGWDFHLEEDPVIATAIRAQTALNLDRGTYSANPNNLDQLCTYPLIFTNNIFHVRDETAQRNLTEYVRRGGFLWVDFCLNLGEFSRPPGKWDFFFDQTVVWFAKVFPKAQMRQLPITDDIYHCFFEIDLKLLWSKVGVRGYWPGSRYGMWGVFEDGRMIALVGVSAVMCGWQTDSAALVTERKRLGANIFVYAMTHSGEGANASH